MQSILQITQEYSTIKTVPFTNITSNHMPRNPFKELKNGVIPIVIILNPRIHQLQHARMDLKSFNLIISEPTTIIQLIKPTSQILSQLSILLTIPIAISSRMELMFSIISQKTITISGWKIQSTTSTIGISSTTHMIQ